MSERDKLREALADIVRHHNPEHPSWTITVPWRVWEAAHEALGEPPPDVFGDMDGQGSDS